MRTLQDVSEKDHTSIITQMICCIATYGRMLLFFRQKSMVLLKRHQEVTSDSMFNFLKPNIKDIASFIKLEKASGKGVLRNGQELPQISAFEVMWANIMLHAKQ